MHKGSTNVHYTFKKKTEYRFFVSRNAKEIEDTCAQDAFVVHDLLYLDFCFAAVFVLAKILPGNVNIIHSS